MIRKLIKDMHFVRTMRENESLAWGAFVKLVQNFHGKHISGNLFITWFQLFMILALIWASKGIFVLVILIAFLKISTVLATYKVKFFHQDIKEVETRYQGLRNIVMIADYCWYLKRVNPVAQHARRTQRRKFIA